MIRITGLRVPPGTGEEALRHKAAALAGVEPQEFQSFAIVRRSVDARKKSAIAVDYAVEVSASPAAEARCLRRCKQAQRVEVLPVFQPILGEEPLRGRPVVVGMGPAGLFAALELAKHGYRPVVWERGGDVETRTRAVEGFFAGGPLSLQDNVQFGEGGAGTFSDGKLTNRGKDPLSHEVLAQLVEAGAPPDILYQHRGHVGTDRLRAILPNLRRRLVAMGGEVYFHTCLSGIAVQNGRLCGVLREDGLCWDTRAVILAIGHSARDTLEGLWSQGLALEAKPCAMGVRIEHLQAWLDRLQYGELAGHPDLGAADYQLSVTMDSRSVYTFCMCPGGSVVNASSEVGRLCVNGMSLHARDGVQCNSALVCQVFPQEYGEGGPLAGMYFQRRLEEAAFCAGGGRAAPAQRVEDFLRQRSTRGFGSVRPTIATGAVPLNLWKVLPGRIAAQLATALPRLDAKLPGFADGDAVMTGVETRTSSTVRMPRGEDGCSVSVDGLYPAGEGAGYAGGIVSAAVDGIRQARKLMARFAPPDGGAEEADYGLFK